MTDDELARPCALLVFTVPERLEVLRRTLAALDERGGPFDGPRVIWWTAPRDRPPPGSLRRGPGWVATHSRFPSRLGGAVEYWEMLRRFPGHDLVVLEDDVDPCRNALTYAQRWQVPAGAAFATFFKGRRHRDGSSYAEGLHPAQGDDGRGFWFSQALKLPAPFVKACLDSGLPQHRSQDVALGLVAEDLGLGVYYHRTLFQHVGQESIGEPGARLTGKRAPAEDFQSELDALTL